MSAQGSEFQKMIKELARRTGKPTQDAQAKKLGVSDTSLAAYLAGTQIPREKTLARMLDAVGIPPQEHTNYLMIRKTADILPYEHANGQELQLLPSAEEGLPAESPVVRRLPRGRFPLWAWGVALIPLGVFVWGGFTLLTSLLPASPATAVVASPPPPALRQCSLVNVLSSPVYVEIGDAEPVKSKVLGDRVRTLPVPRRTGPDGSSYQAVALPNRRDSPNGVGWMRAADLRPDPRQCADPSRRP
ncbi:helix-turn-helix transcriptional regulator [Streptosporangium sp. NPDC049046]|uniref:helix-turn-helix domain-containing protein n=1 Tax=Streptosporangium sp. NPDC049046 TaxID=3155031 RepID=UPI003415CE51